MLNGEDDDFDTIVRGRFVLTTYPNLRSERRCIFWTSKRGDKEETKRAEVDPRFRAESSANEISESEHLVVSRGMRQRRKRIALRCCSV